MKVRTLRDKPGDRMLAVIFDIGDEFMEGLQRVAQSEDLGAASFSAVGAFRRATLGYFEWDAKEYRHIPIDEQVEVVSLSGNIALVEDGSPKIHAHCVLGTREGDARCGHVLSGEVRPTLEVIIEDTPAMLRRRHHPATNLALIDLDAGS